MSRPTTIIRSATSADAAAIRDIYTPFVEETTISFEEQAPSAGEMAERITSTLEQFPYLVATIDHTVVGYAYATPYRKRAAYQWGAEVSVYVDPDHRRAGVARSLYTTLIATLATQGYVNLYAGITLPNDASVAFHESMGFECFAVYEGAGYKFGSWWDVGWWVLFTMERPSRPVPPTPFPLLSG